MSTVNWGNDDVPPELKYLTSAYAGLDSSETFSQTAVYPKYNMRQEIENLWYDEGHEPPPALVQLHNPENDVQDAIDRYEEWDEDVRTLDPDSAYTSAAATVAAAYDAEVSTSAAIDDAVEAFESAQMPAFQRSVSRFNAAMSTINAVHTSSFLGGNAILERGLQDLLADYRAKLELQRQEQRSQSIVTGIGLVLDVARFQLEAGRLATQIRQELSKFNIIANGDYIGNQLKVDTEAELWNLSLLQHVRATNNISGSPTVVGDVPAWQSALAITLNALGSVGTILPTLIQAVKK